MIGVRRIKVFRELWLFKARTVLVVLSIAIGVGGFGLIGAAGTILERDMQRGFDATNPAHAVLSLAPFDSGLIRRVARIPGVVAAEGRQAVTARIAVGPDAWVTLELQAVPDWNAVSISRVIPVPGSPTHPPPGAILLERSTARQFGLVIGQKALVRMPDGEEHALAIAGLVSDQAITPSNINIATAYGYITQETLTTLKQARDYTRLYVQIAGRPAVRSDVEPMVTRLARTLQNNGLMVHSVSIPQPGNPPLQDTMNGVVFILESMSVLTLALSGFLIVNVMWAIVTQQIPQIGVIKSLGGRSIQIVQLYLAMVLVFGILALLVAVPMALGGAYGLVTVTARNLNFSIVSFGLPRATLIALIVTALLVPVLAAMFPILTGARITIREAIGGRVVDGHTRRQNVDGPPDILRRLQAVLPTLLLLSVRNTFRRIGRVVITLVALSLAGAMFIAVLGVRQSLQEVMIAVQATNNYDVEVDFTQPYPIGTILRAARRTRGVTNAEAWGLANARRVFDSDRLSGSMLLIGLPPGTDMTRPSVTAGRPLQAGDAGLLFVNADALNLLQNPTVGEAITLRVGHQSKTWRLIGVGARGFVPIAYVPYADFERVVGAEGYARQLIVQAGADTPQEQRAVEAALLDQLDRAGLEVRESSITADDRRTIAANLDTIVSILMSMVVLVAVVGGLGLGSTLSINVLERAREIGVLRSLGAKTPVVRRVVIVEGLVIGMVSAVIGTIGSLPLGIWLASELGPRLLYRPLDFVFWWPGVALWFVIVAAIAIVASLAPAQSAARLTIRETLAYDG